MRQLYVRGMHGRGDNVHQRAPMRQLMEQYDAVWLESSWLSNYHDLIATGKLRVMLKTTPLRTQRKNGLREVHDFCRERPDLRKCEIRRMWYSPAEIIRAGSVVGAMCVNAECDPKRADFRLPVPAEWLDEVNAVLPSHIDRPILVYRPLCERTEWTGCANRNPDHDAYHRILMTFRDQFFLVSVGDFVKGEEWEVGHSVKADAYYHGGELNHRQMSALFKMAAMVYAAPGYAVPLSQAVGTPVMPVFGGYENSKSFSGGAGFAPYHPIDTVSPCSCFSHHHACSKKIDMDRALPRALEFASHAAAQARS